MAFIADWWRDRLPRRRAAVCAYLERLLLEAAALPSRLSAAEIALERTLDGFRRGCLPFCRSRLACACVLEEALPLLGTGNFTPARRALDSPIAIACCGD